MYCSCHSIHSMVNSCIVHDIQFILWWIHVVFLLNFCACLNLMSDDDDDNNLECYALTWYLMNDREIDAWLWIQWMIWNLLNDQMAMHMLNDPAFFSWMCILNNREFDMWHWMWWKNLHLIKLMTRNISDFLKFPIDLEFTESLF